MCALCCSSPLASRRRACTERGQSAGKQKQERESESEGERAVLKPVCSCPWQIIKPSLTTSLWLSVAWNQGGLCALKASSQLVHFATSRLLETAAAQTSVAPRTFLWQAQQVAHWAGAGPGLPFLWLCPGSPGWRRFLPQGCASALPLPRILPCHSPGLLPYLPCGSLTHCLL